MHLQSTQTCSTLAFRVGCLNVFDGGNEEMVVLVWYGLVAHAIFDITASHFSHDLGTGIV